MISARNALSRLENALAKLRRDEGSIATVLRNLTDEAARLRLERVDSYKALAEVRIDSIRDGELVGHIDSAEQAALSILDRRASRLGELAKQRERVRKELDRAEKDRLKKVDQVKKALKQIDDLDAKI